MCVSKVIVFCAGFFPLYRRDFVYRDGKLSGYKNDFTIRITDSELVSCVVFVKFGVV
jgi:hypothetical protein